MINIIYNNIRNQLQTQARKLFIKIRKILNKEDKNEILVLKGEIINYLDVRYALEPNIERDGFMRDLKKVLTKIDKILLQKQNK